MLWGQDDGAVTSMGKKNHSRFCNPACTCESQPCFLPVGSLLKNLGNNYHLILPWGGLTSFLTSFLYLKASCSGVGGASAVSVLFPDSLCRKC